MTRKAYLIISYTKNEHHGWNPLLNCWKSLRMFEPNELIIVVNNYPHPIHPDIAEDKNLRYHMNTENFWELGAIQTAFFNNPDVDTFFILQDSTLIVNKPPTFETDIVFWYNEFRGIAPVLDRIRTWCKTHFPQLEEKYADRKNKMCPALMGCFTRKTLQALMSMGLQDIRVKDKGEAVASEGLLGLLLFSYKPDIEIYNKTGPSKVCGIENNPSQYEFLKKIPMGRISGEGNSLYAHQPPYICSIDSITHPATLFEFEVKGIKYNSLLDAIKQNPQENYLSIFINYFSQNTKALHELTTQRFGSFIVESNPYNINSFLTSFILHDIWILKHWGYYFPAMYDQIRYNNSFLIDWAFHYRENIFIQYNNNSYIFPKPDTFEEEKCLRSSIYKVLCQNIYNLERYINFQGINIINYNEDTFVASIIIAKQNPSGIFLVQNLSTNEDNLLESALQLNSISNLRRRLT